MNITFIQHINTTAIKPHDNMNTPTLIQYEVYENEYTINHTTIFIYHDHDTMNEQHD